MSEFADRSTDLEDVLGPASVRRLVERLVEAETGEERVRLVESFLLVNLDAARRDEVVIAGVIRLRDSSRVAELAREACLSPRQWTRRFQAAVGLSPKKFARVMRFQRAAALKKRGLDWGAICQVCGYCDQSHLIKEFQSFAGRSFDRFQPGDTPLTRRFNRQGVSLFYNTIYLSSADSSGNDGRSTARPST
jgi:transcriptional regulator GlxA family with amidase domain